MKLCLVALLLLLSQGASLHAQVPAKRAPASQPGSRVISGVVMNAVTSQPVVNAEVSLTDSNGGSFTADSSTDGEGHFAFTGLYDGKFSLHAQHRGYVASGFDEHEGFFTGVVTGTGLVSNDLKFLLAPQAVITGTVTDEAGDPVAQAVVQLFRQDDRSGHEQILHSNSVNADDLGNYEFSKLAAGTYFLAVTGTPWYATHERPKVDEVAHSPLDVAFPMTYYADARNSDDATPIPVKASDRIIINETLQAEPAVHIKLRVPSSPNQGVPMPQLRTKIFGALEPASQQMPLLNTPEDASGASGMTTLELGGVPPGSYELEMQRVGGGPDGITHVDAASGSVTVDPARLESLADVDGKVAMDDGSALPAHISIALVPEEGEKKTAGINADGNFNMHGVAAGEYRLEATGPKGELAVRQVAATGGTVEGNIVKIGGSSLTLAAVVAESNTAVRGFAMRNGKPAPGVMIVLVPADGAPDAYRRDQSDSDGSFVLKQVIPGHYIGVAIEDGWSLEWARSEVMQRYVTQGQKIIVTLHEKDIQLKNPITAQPK